MRERLPGKLACARVCCSNLAAEPKRHDLQLEAAAHIAVQAVIDCGELDAVVHPSALAVELHRLFYQRLPDSLRHVEEVGSGRRIEVRPGGLREGVVKVGWHLAPDASELGTWMARFDECARARFGRAEGLVAVAAHHRLLWIHPFPDGNGRVARLLSHALLRRAGVGSPLWSVARGLAGHVDAYRAYLSRADDPPQGMQDGRVLLYDPADPLHVTADTLWGRWGTSLVLAVLMLIWFAGGVVGLRTRAWRLF